MKRHNFADPELARMAQIAAEIDGTMMAPAGVGVSRVPGDLVPAITPANATAGAMTAGTAIQNLQGYHAVLTVGIVVSTATAATITGGTGTTAALAATNASTIINTFTLASVNWNQVTLFVPFGYFVVVNTTGTITITSLVGTWYPA